MIVDLLKGTYVTETQHTDLFNMLGTWETTLYALNKCMHAHDVLPLLKTEALTRGRIYYVQRIYGRYRKLLPGQDLPDILEYMRENHVEEVKASSEGNEG